MKSPLISIIGMDGSGKTTLTQKLEEELNKKSIKTKIIYTGRGRNNILPIQFFGKHYFKLKNWKESKRKTKRKSQEEVKTNESEKKELSKEEKEKQELVEKTKQNKIKLIHTIAAPIFALDLFLRYWFVIYPARKQNQLVLTDRYSSDVLLIKHVPNFLRKFLYWFLPKPTKTIYLYSTPETLFARKDHPLGDLKRQEKIFNQINKKIKPEKIKSENLEETFNSALKIIMSELNKTN